MGALTISNYYKLKYMKTVVKIILGVFIRIASAIGCAALAVILSLEFSNHAMINMIFYILLFASIAIGLSTIEFLWENVKDE